MARNRIHFELNKNLRALVQQIALSKGCKTPESWLRNEIYRLPKKMENRLVCNKGQCKQTITVAVEDEDVFKFYEVLSCSHSTTLSGIIMKMIIYPAILDILIEAGKGNIAAVAGGNTGGGGK